MIIIIIVAFAAFVGHLCCKLWGITSAYVKYQLKTSMSLKPNHFKQFVLDVYDNFECVVLLLRIEIAVPTAGRASAEAEVCSLGRITYIYIYIYTLRL